MILTGNFMNVVAEEETEDDLDKAADTYNQKKSNDKYKVVCTREAPVGTRIKKKVCRTIAVMENSQRDAKKAMDRLRTSVGNQP